MNYYDNGPFIRSLQDAGSSSNSTPIIAGLVVGLLIASAIAIAQANQLRKANSHLSNLQKTIDTIKAENKKLLAAQTRDPQSPLPS